MIIETEFKGTKAIKFENANLTAIILPEIGGKVASLFSKRKDFEVIFQNKEDVYRKASLYDDFGEFDAAGFDDAFPAIVGGNVKVGDKVIQYPDHGEIWSGSFSYVIKANQAELYFESTILSYSYKKTISLKENGLLIKYEIVNRGTEMFPCIWAAHYLVNCEENMELLLPQGTEHVVNVSSSKFLGAEATVHSYPKTLSLDGEIYHLNKIYPESAKKCEKFYTFEQLNEGSCGIFYPHKDLTYRINFDKTQFPYIGFWVTEGGFRGDYNCALEPANGFYDSIDIAKKEGKVYLLESGAILDFSMEIEIF